MADERLAHGDGTAFFLLRPAHGSPGSLDVICGSFEFAWPHVNTRTLTVIVMAEY